MAGERFGRPQRPAYPGRKARRLVSSQPGRSPYINIPLPPLSLSGFDRGLSDTSVGFSCSFQCGLEKGKCRTSTICGTLGVGYCGWVWGQVTDKKKKKRNSTNADCHSSSRNIKNMNKTHTKEKHKDTTEEG